MRHIKANFAIGLVVGVMAFAAAGTFVAVSAQEESQWDEAESVEEDSQRDGAVPVVEDSRREGTVAIREKSQWDGVYSGDQAKRGAPLYAQHCSSCHGPDLGGGEMAPGLWGGDLAVNWNDLTLGDLFDRMRTSMPQNNPGSLSRQQNADILAFMLFTQDAPEGTTELPTQPELLNTIKYLATRP